MVYFRRQELQLIRELLRLNTDRISQSIIDKINAELARPRATSLTRNTLFLSNDENIQMNYNEGA